MAFLPLDFDTHPDFTTVPRSRSLMTPGRQIYSAMVPSQESTSPHGHRHRHALAGPRDRRSPASPTQTSMRVYYPADYRESVASNPMSDEQLYSLPPSPRSRPQPLSYRRSPGPVSQRRICNADHDSLIAMGSWTSQSTHNEEPCTRSGREKGSSTFHNGDLLAKDASYDDFILFPDDARECIHGDFTAPAQPSSAPRAPRITRLRTLDLAPLSTDVQFFPCLGGESERDRINEAWYIAGRERVESQRFDHEREREWNWEQK
ncbi:uncharacterized protein BDZ83DRAFT_650431 [Colletotrichum acutatum]|uniref:Uncharacterized protein n=1 Tax=Glomerella acutata TaxID=27357 RepID=A0AAD8URQ6_GLOAC|nr:uncharacterized protein BDZ83DRAFT_650431 [Colletotrichum acutatum]KAK1726503.1 hypothetical protein BDZ83DRAFT_650431 [Colletotrichum acutatum]